MNFSWKKILGLLLLLVVFVVLFLTVYLWVTSTDYGYSMPSWGLSPVSFDIGVSLGPKPNATGVALDTTIRIYTMRDTTVKDLRLTPEVPIARTSEEIGYVPAYGMYTFYPAEPLKPATTYDVSVFIMRETVSWSFTTTSEPLQSEISFFIANNVFWVALLVATAGTSVIGVLVWIKRRHV